MVAAICFFIRIFKIIEIFTNKSKVIYNFLVLRCKLGHVCSLVLTQLHSGGKSHFHFPPVFRWYCTCNLNYFQPMMGPPPTRRGSTSDGAQKPCPYCTKTVSDIDWFLPCSRCGVNCHHKCLALDDKGFKAIKETLGKVPKGLLNIYCLCCREKLDGFENGFLTSRPNRTVRGLLTRPLSPGSCRR